MWGEQCASRGSCVVHGGCWWPLLRSEIDGNPRVFEFGPSVVGPFVTWLVFWAVLCNWVFGLICKWTHLMICFNFGFLYV
ncbi:hypothetical protein ES288_A03G204800v1 [Gossypium darwinii]|nr:hypothetical protein ES288_A03G204800v1 [Gossypium darwinii]